MNENQKESIELFNAAQSSVVRASRQLADLRMHLPRFSTPKTDELRTLINGLEHQLSGAENILEIINRGLRSSTYRRDSDSDSE